MDTRAPYLGRFAPTPSGPLHFGSMVAALGSFLDARAHGGEWHVRIDDLDPPRVQPGAADLILESLERCGLHWDGPVVWQSTHQAEYQHALERLAQVAHVYACSCSRAQIAAAGLTGIEGYRYPGTCREVANVKSDDLALRIEAPDSIIEFDDLLQGHTQQNLQRDIGDFVLRRADGVYSYHLACAVDDGLSTFTHVVRGADLIDSTHRQILIQRLLNLPSPQYLHLPVAVDSDGNKLSKQTLAAPVDVRYPVPLLVSVLAFLNHAPPASDVPQHDLATLLNWATQNWHREALFTLGKRRLIPNLP